MTATPATPATSATAGTPDRFPAVPVIETARLRLRGHRMADYAAYATFYASERAVHVGGPYPARHAWNSFAGDAGHWSLKGFGWWIVTEKGDDAALGTVGLHQPPQHPEPELGWTLFADAEGKGFAREAAEVVRDWAWARLGALSLVSYIAPGNGRSIALAERLGARLDRAAERPANAPDVLVYRHPGPEAAR